MQKKTNLYLPTKEASIRTLIDAIQNMDDQLKTSAIEIVAHSPEFESKYIPLLVKIVEKIKDDYWRSFGLQKLVKSHHFDPRCFLDVINIARGIGDDSVLKAMVLSSIAKSPNFDPQYIPNVIEAVNEIKEDDMKYEALRDIVQTPKFDKKYVPLVKSSIESIKTSDRKDALLDILDEPQTFQQMIQSQQEISKSTDKISIG